MPTVSALSDTPRTMRNGFRLLVVEDDVPLCECIADALRFSGYEVDTAGDGEAALRFLREAPRPDAILLDMVLPRMSADRLLDAIAAWVRPPPAVVLMTGMVPQPATQARAPDVMMKPFDVDELLARVARALAPPAWGDSPATP